MLVKVTYTKNQVLAYKGKFKSDRESEKIISSNDILNGIRTGLYEYQK